MLYAVIMAGGSGTRFWPESRQARPKQLLKFADDKTMIRSTVERILPEVPFERIMVVTSALHAEGIRSQLPELPAGMIVAEPVGRNTAACIAVAAYKLAKLDPEAVMVVLASDHLIGKPEEFGKALRWAHEVAVTRDYLMTFGIKPDCPETGYGYILVGSTVQDDGDLAVSRVEQFVEKPDKATARAYVDSGRYLWNSGMFVWKATTIIKAIETHLPGLSSVMESILPELNGEDETAAIASAYERIESVSIDYGVMEKAENVMVIPVDIEWNDVGCWTSLKAIWGEDSDGNVCKGNLVAVDSRGCIVCSPHKVAALLGVDDLIIVDTPDAVLVCRKDRAQDVRRLQKILRERGHDNLL